MTDLRAEFAAFLESRQATCRAETIATYRQCVTAFAAWLDGRPIAPGVVRTYLIGLKTRGLADETQHNHYRQLKTLCRWLVDEGLLDRDPFSGRGRVLPPRQRRRRRQTYSEADVVALLRATGPVVWKRGRRTTRQQWQPGGPLAREAPQGRALVLLLVDSALRAAEVCALSCGQVRKSVLVIVGKGGHEGVAFITPETRAALRELAGQRADDAPLFRNWDGNRCTPRDLRTLLRRLADRAGVTLPPRPLHAFRHYAAQQWVKAKVPDLAIQQLMRHADLQTTQIYTRNAPPELLAALHAGASRIAAILEAAGLAVNDAP